MIYAFEIKMLILDIQKTKKIRGRILFSCIEKGYQVDRKHYEKQNCDLKDSWKVCNILLKEATENEDGENSLKRYSKG